MPLHQPVSKTADRPSLELDLRDAAARLQASEGEVPNDDLIQKAIGVISEALEEMGINVSEALEDFLSGLTANNLALAVQAIKSVRLIGDSLVGNITGDPDAFAPNAQVALDSAEAAQALPVGLIERLRKRKQSWLIQAAA